MKNIYLIVGQSGSGKDAVVNAACEKYGYNRLCSYTTRKQRNDANDELSHFFASFSDYYRDRDSGQVVADTIYDNNAYWATKDQVDNSDIYIIDMRGVKKLRENYQSKGVVIIGITADEDVRRSRMQKRGDSPKDIDSRIKQDEEEFAELHSVADVVIRNDADMTVTQAADLLHSMIEELEQL